jgi:hypothetical protein
MAEVRVGVDWLDTEQARLLPTQLTIRFQKGFAFILAKGVRKKNKIKKSQRMNCFDRVCLLPEERAVTSQTENRSQSCNRKWMSMVSEN